MSKTSTKKTRRGQKSKKTANRRHSSFWDGDVLTTRGVDKNSMEYIMKLAAHRRAMANFVTILTGKQIPVVYPESGQSYTDGSSVTIGSTVNEQSFDSTVGLALHEASHIVHSDFELVRRIMSVGMLDTMIFHSTLSTLRSKGYSDYAVRHILKTLVNYVEDRWIDHLTYQAAPGYRPYYEALYARYWHSAEIDELVASNAHRDESLTAYMSRIINFTNEHTDLDALKGLRQIWQILDLGNIGRIQSTQGSLDIAARMLGVIAEHVTDMTEQDRKNAEKGPSVDEGDFSSAGDGDGAGDESGENDDSDSSETNGAGAGDEDGEETDAGDGADANEDGENETPSKNKIKKMNKALQEQKKMLDGEVSKTQVTQKANRDIRSVEEAGVEIVSAGGQPLPDSKARVEKVKVFVVKKVTESLIESGRFPFAVRAQYGEDREAARGVQAGLIAGKQLVKKLVVRNEEKSIKYNRLNKGRLDRSLIHELGFNADSVFQQTVHTVYSDAFLHISIDASGSMTSGNKWYQAIKVATSLAYAATKIEGLDVRVDVRGTCGSSYSYNNAALVAIVYDSRVDNIAKIRKLFPRLTTFGTTPESLCFEAIMGIMVEGNAQRDSYFLNMSDGEPGFGGYFGEPAFAHARMMVKKMKAMGIKVLSYFIGQDSASYRGSSHEQFRRMYGRDARFIDVDSVFQIAKTMNQMFLENGKRDA